jgi:hypothetical protein
MSCLTLPDGRFVGTPAREEYLGWDVGILFDWFKGNGAKLRAMMGG